MTNDYVPNVTDLVAGELARAADINTRYGYVISGFDKLPQPLPGGGGFNVPVAVGTPTADAHAVTKLYSDTTVAAAAVAAAEPAARTAALAAVAPEVTAAANSATAAANSATAAAQSASDAVTDALAAVAPEVTAAANSATAAAGSATTASNHVATALGHANTAQTHANTSLSHANTAQGHASTALGHANSAQTILDNFEDKYLGAHASAPSTSGVQQGAIYWNSTANQLYILDGSTWNQGAFSVAGALISTNNLSELSDAGAAVTNLGLRFNTIAVTVAGGKFVIDGTPQQSTRLTPSVRYRFDQSDASNAGHPIKFSTTSDGTHGAGGAAFTTGVTVVGTPGQAGAYTDIILEQDSPALYYYCQNHSGMGGRAYSLVSGGGGGAGGGTATGDMTGYYVVASPPEDIVFKPTYTVMPNNHTVIGTFQGFTDEATTLHISDLSTIDTDGSYVAEDTTISGGHLFYKLYHIATGKTVTVGGTDTIQGLGEAPVGGSAAVDQTRSSGELIYFGDL